MESIYFLVWGTSIPTCFYIHFRWLLSAVSVAMLCIHSVRFFVTHFLFPFRFPFFSVFVCSFISRRTSSLLLILFLQLFLALRWWFVWLLVVVLNLQARSGLVHWILLFSPSFPMFGHIVRSISIFLFHHFVIHFKKKQRNTLTSNRDLSIRHTMNIIYNTWFNKCL